MSTKLIKMTAATIANVKTLTFLVLMTVGSSAALAQLDPSMEMFRIRCQIDEDIDPVTNELLPKVQIQGKARAELLDGWQVTFDVINTTNLAAPSPADVDTVFDLGSASADWDTFPDDADDPTPVTPVDGTFVASDDVIRVTATVVSVVDPSVRQSVAGEAQCADKRSSQFKQDTKGVCKLKDELRRKCKIGDILSNGEIFDGSNYPPPPP
jgi:hypothetical protein